MTPIANEWLLALVRMEFGIQPDLESYCNLICFLDGEGLL